MHSSSLPRLFCRYCGKPWRSVEQLMRHDCTTQHVELVQCPHCDARFAHLEALRQHIGAAHNNVFTCHVCFKQFRQRCHLLTHLAQHTGDKRFVCVVCEKAFARKDTLDVHMKVHNNERAYECQQCGAKFKQRGHLLRHEVVHRRIDYKCQQCGEVYGVDSDLRRHLEVTHGVRFK